MSIRMKLKRAMSRILRKFWKGIDGFISTVVESTMEEFLKFWKVVEDHIRTIFISITIAFGVAGLIVINVNHYSFVKLITWAAFTFYVVVVVVLLVWRETDKLKGKSLAVGLTHLICLTSLASLAEYTGLGIPDNNVDPSIFICQTLFSAVELLTVLLYAWDVRKLGPAGMNRRWWIRTVPYPVFGLCFVVYSFIRYLGGLANQTVISVFVTLLSTTYVFQIINERLIPKEGPFKEIRDAPASRSRGGRGTS